MLLVVCELCRLRTQLNKLPVRRYASSSPQIIAVFALFFSGHHYLGHRSNHSDNVDPGVGTCHTATNFCRRSVNQSVAALQSALEQADHERQALESRLQQEAARTLEQASTTPELLQRDLEQTREQVARLQQELEQLRQRQNAAKHQEDAALARSLDRNAHRKELEDLKTKASAAESERQQIVNGNQLIFNRPSGTTKRPWLVDVSGRFDCCLVIRQRRRALRVPQPIAKLLHRSIGRVGAHELQLAR